MPVVVPLSEKPAHEQMRQALDAVLDQVQDGCEHIAYKVLGKSNTSGVVHEWRKCSDCGHRWTDEDLSGEADEWQEEAAPGKPPKAVYGHAQVVTYQTETGQYDLVVGELAMVSTQNGLLVVQHHNANVVGIVGVRPWLEEAKDEPDTEG